MIDYFPRRDDRALIAGQTGSGKSAFAVWLLGKLSWPALIYDTKIEPKFDKLGPVVDSFDAAKKLFKRHDLITLRPPVDITIEPLALDDLLLRHYAELQGHGAYIDEVLQFHNGNRAEKGLISLLTRGRSRHISTIMSTQRPRGLSRFCLTEAQRFYIFRLIDRDDNRRLGDVIPGMADAERLPRYWHYYYEAGQDHVYPVKPVDIQPIDFPRKNGETIRAAKWI